MIYVKESRNNILLEHEENTLSIAKNTASYFSSLNSNIDLLLYGTEIQSLIHSYADKKLSPEEVQSQGYNIRSKKTVNLFLLLPCRKNIIHCPEYITSEIDN